MRKGIYRGLCLDHRVQHVGVGIDLLVFMWLVWVRAPVHHEWGEVKERSSIGFDHSLDDVNNTAMAESINLQQRGVVFRLELFPFYREADEHCQRTPTILYLEWIRPILEVVCYVTAGTFARRGLSSTAKTLRSLVWVVRGYEY